MKFVGAISSFLCGVLMFVCTSLIVCGGTLKVLGTNNYATGWDILKISSDASQIVFFKIFAIAGMVVAGILILCALFLFLKDTGVVKIKSKLNFYLINNVLLFVFMLCAIGFFFGAMASSVKLYDESVFNSYVGVGAWVLMISAVVFCLLGWICSRNGGKKSK